VGVLATGNARAPREARTASSEAGFSLVEVLISVLVLVVALLSLAGVFTMSLARTTTASADVIAKEQASEAIEGIFAARDAGRLTWTQLNNEASGGIFKDGLQDLIDPGPDRIPNTTDDDKDTKVTITKPGPNGNLGDADDKIMPLVTYKREVKIVPSKTSADTLREIHVIMEYSASGFKRHYEMVSYISKYGS
jgi:type II secretory pathway pseudopilin PulG